jgi:hypothetical protein
MWLTGTIVYALVVIVVTVKVMFSTHTHTIISSSVMLLSVASFFVMFYLENTAAFIPQLF